MKLGDLPVGSKFEFCGKPGVVLYSNDSRVLVRWLGMEKSWAPCTRVKRIKTDATGRADSSSAPATGNGTGGLSADGSPDTVFVEKLATYWDSHDMTDFDDHFEEVPIAEHTETVNVGADPVLAATASDKRRKAGVAAGGGRGDQLQASNAAAAGGVREARDEVLSRPEWLIARTKGIGSSDSPKILAGSALAVYQSKVAPQPDEWRWEFARGNAMEDVIARQFAEDHPEIAVEPFVRAIYNHPEHDWLICTPDRILRRKSAFEESAPLDILPPFGVLEMKTWSGRDWRAWAEGIPLHIQIQVQHQLLVSGFDEAWVSVSIGGDPPEHYHVEANERFHRVLVQVLAEFWVRVQERNPPEPDGSEASRDAIAALWPREAKGKVISLPPAFSVTDEHRELLKAEIAKRKAELDEIDNRIKAAMGDAESALLDSGVEYTLRQQTRKAYRVAEASFRVLRRKAAE